MIMTDKSGRPLVEVEWPQRLITKAQNVIDNQHKIMYNVHLQEFKYAQLG